MILRNKSAIAIVLFLCATVAAQTKSFTPVEGANLKAKIENAIINGKANARLAVARRMRRYRS